MRKVITVMIATAFALAVLPAGAQTKAPATKGAVKQTKTAKTTAAVAEKKSGIVKGAATGSKFVLGVKDGPFNVDATGAKCTYQGKAFKVSDLKGGNMVTVMGKATGKNIKATEVKVTYIRAAKPKGAVTAPKTPAKKK